MEDSISRFVASQALLGEMLMALSQALNLSKPGNREMVKNDSYIRNPDIVSLGFYPTTIDCFLDSPGVQSHGGVGGVLGEVEVGGPPELLLDDQRLLQQFEPPGQELVLDLQEVALAYVHL